MTRCFVVLFISALSLHADLVSCTITENSSHGANYFVMHHEETYEGRVTNNRFLLQRLYDLYDPAGSYEARGICKILTFGFFYAWAKNIDVYDAEGEKIGFIDGQLLTTTSAHFNFYDSDDTLIATTDLDCSAPEFIVVTPGALTIARLRHNMDSWELYDFNPDLLDPRIIKIFSAYAINFQYEFQEFGS